jgi:hypothetical protein
LIGMLSPTHMHTHVARSPWPRLVSTSVWICCECAVCVCLPLVQGSIPASPAIRQRSAGGRRGAVAMEQLVAAVSASDSSHAMRATGVHGGRCALPLCVLCGHVVVYLCDQTGCLFPLALVIKMGQYRATTWPEGVCACAVASGGALSWGGSWPARTYPFVERYGCSKAVLVRVTASTVPSCKPM